VPFGPAAALDVIVVAHKVFGRFVNGLVSEVHHQVVHVGVRGFLLLGRAEAQEAVVVYPDPERVNGCD